MTVTEICDTYLQDYEIRPGAPAKLRSGFDVYKNRRPHDAIDGRPPDVFDRARTTIMQPDRGTRSAV